MGIARRDVTGITITGHSYTQGLPLLDVPGAWVFAGGFAAPRSLTVRAAGNRVVLRLPLRSH
jgi:hypothetical protein